MEEEEEEGGAGWLVSYADLMTLLFAAFVVLYGITPQGESTEVLGVIASIRESFIEIPDEVTHSFKDSELFQKREVFQAVKKNNIQNPAIKKFNRRESPLRAPSKEQQEIDVQKPQDSSQGSGLHQSLRRRTVTAMREYGYTKKPLGTISFEYGSKKLDLAARAKLTQIGKIAKSAGHIILIEGHSQSRPHPQASSAIELAAKRASVTKRYLIKELRYPRDRIQTTSLGAMHPKDSQNKSPHNNPNDRVEIKIME